MATTITPRIPGPALSWDVIRKVQRDPVGFLSWMAQYGDVACIMVRGTPNLLVSHPDAIRDILVTHPDHFVKGPQMQRVKLLMGNGLILSEGEEHRQHRRMMQPAFHKKRIEEYAATMVAYSQRMQESWRDGDVVDLAEVLQRLGVAIVAKTLFDVDLAGDAPEVADAISAALAIFNKYTGLPLSKLLYRLPLPDTLRFWRARGQLHAYLQRIIQAHTAAHDESDDLLSLLLQARAEGMMSEQQIEDELMTLLIAGSETVAIGLTWTFYLLSQHPDIEARLHAELAEVLGGRIPTVADVPHLRYTQMVFAEALRLYPPTFALSRETVAEHQIGEHRIPIGATVAVSPYVVQHDARWWPEPERFDPERFVPASHADRPKFAYFPFGGGSRQCIGESFAWMEGVLVLATLAQRWHFQPVAHNVERGNMITLRPKGGMKMQIHSLPAHEVEI